MAWPAIMRGVCLFSVSYDLVASLNEPSSACDGVRWIHKGVPVLTQRQNCISEGYMAQIRRSLQPPAEIKTVHVSAFACMCM